MITDLPSELMSAPVAGPVAVRDQPAADADEPADRLGLDGADDIRRPGWAPA